jgi:hypothetical protein
LEQRKYSVIVSDLGNVLIPFDYNIAYSKLEKIEKGLGQRFLDQYKENYDFHRSFERGEAVGCLDPDGREVARGLVNYSASESRAIMRKPSSEIEGQLGYVDEPELIHRDNLVLL